MAGATGKRHAVLLFTVLAGLFLMHGVSAPAMHGMPMPTPMAASMPAPMSVSASPQQTPTAAPTTEDSTDPVSAPMQSGMTCIPLRPEGLSALFLALFLIVITPRGPRLPVPARLVHSRWPHGPPRTGVQILHTLSISRT